MILLEVIQKYIQENPALITSIIGPIIQEGAGKAIMTAVSNMFASDMVSLQNNVLSRLQTQR